VTATTFAERRTVKHLGKSPFIPPEPSFAPGKGIGGEDFKRTTIAIPGASTTASVLVLP
jgi:hypothetical protein